MRKIFLILLVSVIFLNGFSFKESNSKKYIILTSKQLALSASIFKTLHEKDYDVTVLYTEEIGKKEDQIRNYLKSHFKEGYLLIIGSPDTVPQGTLYPKMGSSSSVLPQSIKTDVYYSMLSENLDKDLDGYPGELFDDRIIFKQDLYVGRIPFDSDKEVLKVYESIFKFQKTQPQKVVLAASFISFPGEEYFGSKIFNGDGAREMELIKEFFPGAVTLYEKEGSFPSSFLCSFPLTKENFLKVLNDAAVVSWSSHGSRTGAFRSYWNDKNGNGIPDETYTMPSFVSSEDYFNTNSIIFSGSCLNLNGKDNLGKSFLEKGAAAFIGSTEVSFTPSYFSKPLDGGSATVNYYFLKYLKEGMPVGKAMYDSLEFFYNFALFADIEDPLEAGISVIYGLNLYGDPALRWNYEESNVKNPTQQKTLLKDISIDLVSDRNFNLEIYNPRNQSFFCELPDAFYVEQISGTNCILDRLSNSIRVNGASNCLIKGKIRGKADGEIKLFNDFLELIEPISLEGFKKSDLNFDGKIDNLDLGILLTAFGKTYLDPSFNNLCDMNFDLKVNGFDLLIFFYN